MTPPAGPYLDCAAIRRLRYAAGLSIERAAARAGFGNAPQWHALENGDNPNPTARTICRVAFALRVPPGAILVPCGGSPCPPAASNSPAVPS